MIFLFPAHDYANSFFAFGTVVINGGCYALFVIGTPLLETGDNFSGFDGEGSPSLFLNWQQT